MKTNEILEELGKNLTNVTKKNKGALIGAVIGYLLDGNKKAQSTILGLLAGRSIIDTKDDQEEEYNDYE